MKILHVTQNYHPSIGGTQHTIKKISEYFYAAKHDEVTVFTSNSLYGPNRQKFKEIPVQEEVINGVRVKRFSYLRLHIPVIKNVAKVLKRVFNQPLPGYLQALLSGPISRQMEKEINAFDADVIGASSIDYLFADYPAKRKRKHKPKPFVMYGALHLHNTPISATNKKRVALADYYIANTAYEKNVLTSLGIDKERIKVIGAATDIFSHADFSISDEQLRTAYNIAPGTIVITFIGRQEVLKGVPALITAFLSLCSSFTNISLFVCGASGGYTGELQHLASTNSNIQIFSNVTDLKKTEILRVTDILVLPSKEESFGVVFLEAWSFGKPVVGAGIGAVASLIDDGVDGILFTPDDSNDLTEKLTLLIQDESLRIQLGKNGNKKLKEHYTWDIIAEKFREVYKLAIAKFKNQQGN